MELGQYVSIPEIPVLGLQAMEADLGTSEMRRDVKIYKVPQSVSDDQYYISATEAGGIEEVPPSRSRDNTPLAHYTLDSDGNTIVKYQHEELQNA